MILFIWHSCQDKTLGTALPMAEYRRRGGRELVGVIDLFYVLMVMVVIQLSAFVKTRTDARTKKGELHCM